MYLKPKHQKYFILDIECDSLQPTKIWCVCLKNTETQEEFLFLTQEEFKSWHEKDNIYIGHNIISFDAPNLNRLWDTKIVLEDCIDTLILSYLYNPALENGHSLEAWGQRFKFYKGQFSDWSKLSEEMIIYCKRDVDLTLKIYNGLRKKMISLGYSELSCEIEHHIRIVIDEQQVHGFWFNKVGASDFLVKLRERQSDLTKEIQSLFPATRILVKEHRRRRNKDGSLCSQYLKDALVFEVLDYIHEGEEVYAAYMYEEFNIGSPKQRVERLLEVGWEPEKFTKKGFPQVDEDSLVSFAELSGRSEVKAMAEWLVLQGRSSMVETWLNNLGIDSRIHGRVMTCGATTRRMTHSNPNTANIPSGAKAKYGHECRSLWGVRPGQDLVLVGYDAAGLETAGLCHYLNNPKATEVLLRSKPDDIHTTNARRLTEALGRSVDREWGAKTTWYAWLYSAYPKKLGEILKGSPEDGEIVIETFYRNVPGLKGLIQGVQNEFKRNSGLLETIDGGFVRCPSVGASLNYKIQSAGAIVMKLTSILLRQRAKEQGILFHKVGDIHDEGQLEVHRNQAEELGKLAVECITEAGQVLKFNVPLTGDYKIGTAWSMTH